MHNRAAFQIPHRKIAFLSGFRCLCSCPAETELTIVVDGVALGAGRGENKGGRGGAIPSTFSCSTLLPDPACSPVRQ